MRKEVKLLRIIRPKIEEIFNLNKNMVNDCWIWTGAKFFSGYGRFFHKDLDVRVHRLSFLFYKGYLLKDKVIDHKCRNHDCFNPDHLRQVSHRTNTLYNSNSIQAKNYRKTHCSRGHKLTKSNIYNQPNTNFRYCKKCRIIYHQKHKDKTLNEKKENN